MYIPCIFLELLSFDITYLFCQWEKLLESNLYLLEFYQASHTGLKRREKFKSWVLFGAFYKTVDFVN